MSRRWPSSKDGGFFRFGKNINILDNKVTELYDVFTSNTIIHAYPKA